MTRRIALLLAALGLVLLSAGGAFAAEGDFNGDGVVDGSDQQILLDAVGSVAGDENFVAGGDADGDGVITLQDVSAFLKLPR